MTRRTLAKYAADLITAGSAAKAVARQLAAGLIEAGREKEVELLLNDIYWELENRGQLALAKVSTARSLPRELTNELTAKLKKATGVRSISLETEVDKSIIGGIKVETASRVWDETVSRKLSDLREAF